MGKTPGHAGAAFEFLVDAFERIGGAHALLVGGGVASMINRSLSQFQVGYFGAASQAGFLDGLLQ